MAQAWPGTLQEILNQAGFGITIGDTKVTNDMDVGPSKVRARYTKSIDTFTGTIWVDTATYSTFLTFYQNTLNNGVTSFDFDHPITGTLQEFRFRSPPNISYVGGSTFTISMEWETVP